MRGLARDKRAYPRRLVEAIAIVRVKGSTGSSYGDLFRPEVIAKTKRAFTRTSPPCAKLTTDR